MYTTIKTFGNDRGFSCAFRQPLAQSHCHLVHGYSLGFRFTVEAQELDTNNWCYDYGNFKVIKKFLEDNFDHTTAVADTDTHIDWFRQAHLKGILNLKTFPAVGCEKFAEFVYEFAAKYINEQTMGRAKLKSVEVFEHGSNSAIYTG